MSNLPYSKPWVLGLVVALAAILAAGVATAGPAGHLAHAQAADSSIDFTENGTAPVAAFVAHDQDGDPIVWSLSGPDADLFTIDDGLLAFREPPNYEDSKSRAGGSVYNLTIVAGGSTHDVAVTITDVDEAGTVSIDRPQPQADRPLLATLLEEDEGVSGQLWQWARSGDGEAWTDIAGATSPRRSPAPDDEGMYLRATVTYDDKFGGGKTASTVSANRVEPRTLSNAAPSLAGQDDDKVTPYIDIARSVAENAAVGRPVGKPVSATDADEDILFYELLDTPDLEEDNGDPRFTIGSATGQIRVGKVLGADAGEREDEDSRSLTGSPPLPADEDADDPGNGEYVLRVRVSDPSTASATVNVVVTVADVNEPPRFSEDVPTVLSVVENGKIITAADSGTPVDANTYAVTDRDVSSTGPQTYDDSASYMYSVSGADHRDFVLNGRGLGFRTEHQVDYEKKSSYSITIEAQSGEGRRRLTARLDVTVEVVDAEDPGELSLSQREPQVGSEVYGTVSDPDGGVTVTKWVWERSDRITVDDAGTPSADCRPGTDMPVVEGWTQIDGASSSVYTVKEADVDRCLRAAATYTDDVENADGDEQVTGVTEAPVQISNPANTAPHFLDLFHRASRKVAENTEPRKDIGMPVSAHDEDGDLLIHTLGGADAAYFDISRNNGQIKTRAALDYEARRSYAVEVTATDPSGASDTIVVTISVTNRNEPAQITGNSSWSYAENGTGPVGAFSASDQDGGSVRWSLSGRDEDLFTISRGALRFKEPPNFEAPQSAVAGASLAERNVYRVTIEASGGSRDVAVTVMDVDEAGSVVIDRLQPQAERPLSASLRDEDHGVTAERWQWARSQDGTTWTDIEGAMSPRRSPSPADEDMYLRATVTYSDKFGVGKTVSAVSANRVEARTTANAAPSFAELYENEAMPHVDVARSVAENAALGTAIGKPVSASDEDEDVLFYELLDTPDLADNDGNVRFTIDSATGQIRVAEELGADAGEREDEDSTALTADLGLTGDEDPGSAGNSDYVLRVRASDPSTASATVNVIVKVTEVNEPPTFKEGAPTVLRVTENEATLVFRLDDDETNLADDDYTAEDRDEDDSCCTYSVSGADRSSFTIDSAGVLSFRTSHEPDFERKNSYTITIEARSGEGSRRLAATLDVTIEVVNAEDEGKVLLSQRQPQVGIEIVATLSDPDGGVNIIRWTWQRSAVVADRKAKCATDGVASDWTPIGGASSAVYAPKAADFGRCLRVRADYTDALDDTELEAPGVLEVPVGRHGSADTTPTSDGGFVNAAPAFPDQDLLTPGVQNAETSRQVPENTKAAQPIGSPVSAGDADDDLLIYTLGGPDAAYFDISRNNGQIRTRRPLNYEERNIYTVIVTATDPFGAAASILVTINVTDKDDPAEITVH